MASLQSHRCARSMAGRERYERGMKLGKCVNRRHGKLGDTEKSSENVFDEYIGIQSIECINMAAVERSAWQIFVRIEQAVCREENAVPGESLPGSGNIYLRSRGAKEHVSFACFLLCNALHRAPPFIDLSNPLVPSKNTKRNAVTQ